MVWTLRAERRLLDEGEKHVVRGELGSRMLATEVMGRLGLDLRGLICITLLFWRALFCI